MTTSAEATQRENFFNLNDREQGLSRALATGLSTRIFAGERVMLSVVEVEPHAEGSEHSHPEEQWGLLLEGDGVRLQGGERVAVSAGDFWLTPGNVRHTFKAGPQGATILDIFSPPREEYRSSRDP